MLDISIKRERDPMYFADRFGLKSSAYVWRGDTAKKQVVVYFFRVADSEARNIGSRLAVERQIDRARREIAAKMMPGVMRHWIVEKTPEGQLIRPIDPANPRAKTLPQVRPNA